MVGAGGLYKGNALYETPCNKGSERKPIGVVFKAPHKPKLSFQKLIEWLSGGRRS